MKRIILLALLAIPWAALAQDSVNPYLIQQHGNIILQNTDVYYNPFAPPGPFDTREKLSSLSAFYQDSNGIGDGAYVPLVYDSLHHQFDTLANWAPHGSAIGPYTPWQRLFQGDTITAGGGAGDRVTIGKNEDVDFRARHLIKLKSGFQVKPGAFFHAYTEPHWDTAVFSDEFDDTAKFRRQWYIFNGMNGVSGWSIPQCQYDSSVFLDTDYEAHDGHALDLVFRLNPDTCSCDSVNILLNSCSDVNIPDSLGNPLIHRSLTSSGSVMSCPWPVYAHAPYGKYEFRDKIPRMHHHTNNWGGGGGQTFEYDLDETFNGEMGIMHPNWGHGYRFGPCHGYFQIRGAPYNDTSFISLDDTACTSAWEPTGQMNNLIINNIGYGVYPWRLPPHTVRPNPGTSFPSSLATSSDTFTYYYCRWNWLPTDSVTWRVDTATDGKYRIFHAPYHIRSGDSIFFTKQYQPVMLALGSSVNVKGDTVQKKYHCHWIYLLNNPTNKGILYLDDPLDSADLKTNRESFVYELPDAYAGGPGYGVPAMLTGADTTFDYGDSVDGYRRDSAAYTAEPYRYHTFTMEWLPHEVRILYDSVVVRRWPDRMIPQGSPFYDYASTMARGPVYLIPGGFSMDGDPVVSSSWSGLSSVNYFRTHAGYPGFWPFHGQNAAHHLIDYVKVWDLPKTVIVASFPH